MEKIKSDPEEPLNSDAEIKTNITIIKEITKITFPAIIC